MGIHIQETPTHPGGYDPDENEITRCAHCETDFEFDSLNEEFTVPYTSAAGKGFCGEGCELADAANLTFIVERALMLIKYHAPNARDAWVLQNKLDLYKAKWPKIEQTLKES